MVGKFLQMTNNHFAMRESVPRVPKINLAGPSGTDATKKHYTEGIKAQSGRFHLAYLTGLNLFLRIFI